MMAVTLKDKPMSIPLRISSFSFPSFCLILARLTIFGKRIPGEWEEIMEEA